MIETMHAAPGVGLAANQRFQAMSHAARAVEAYGPAAEPGGVRGRGPTPGGPGCAAHRRSDPGSGHTPVGSTITRTLSRGRTVAASRSHSVAWSVARTHQPASPAT